MLVNILFSLIFTRLFPISPSPICLFVSLISVLDIPDITENTDITIC